jgi:hypothetical protein
VNRRLLPYIPLPTTDPGDPLGGGPAPVPPAPVPPVPVPPKTFTQAELDAINARTRSEATRAANNALFTALGVTSQQEADALVKKAREADEAGKTEAQRAQAAADTARTVAEQATAQAAADRLATLTERALIRAGLPLEVDDAAGAKVENPQLAYALRLVDVPAGSDEATIKTAVEAVKATFPQMFTSTAAAPAAPSSLQPPRPPATPGGKPSTPQEMAARAREQFGYGTRKTTT